ncbi:MAG TPA: ligase-associated DNA damage response endonuclease PdeM, partial [Burkholderiaceae bacterium]|nr:ligase-associated DNA damage response endonuclease PdeM [Burkholderiaceae bacterium]
GLHASGAAYLAQARTLLIADAHFGKAVSFRKLGVPVPSGTTTETLKQISAVVAETGAKHIVFLGDFLHSVHSHAAGTLEALAQWRSAHAALALTLVRGNHDDRAGDPPAHLRITVVDEPLPFGPFALCHHPQSRPQAYVLAGHWHPCVGLSGRANEHLRLKCFWLGSEASYPVGILPAFGSFTGMHPIQNRPGDRVFAVADTKVREVASLASTVRS